MSNQILGIRTSVNVVRYAVIEGEDEKIIFVNSGEENRLVFPAECQCISDKLLWLHREMLSVFKKYNIEKVAIKTNEYVREKLSTRPSTHLDAGIMLTAALSNIEVYTKLYSNIEKGLGSKKVKEIAEQYVGRTVKYWDVQMADAIVVALSELGGRQ